MLNPINSIFIKTDKMKKLVFLLLMLPGILWSQEVNKKIKIGSMVTEIYQISDDTKVKNGSYVVLSNMQADTLVLGQYRDGVKTGRWNYLKNDGSIIIQYDYTADSCAWIHPMVCHSDTFLVGTGDGNFVPAKVERPPLLIGYFNEMKVRFVSDFKIPMEMLGSMKPYSLIGTFVIGADGKVGSMNSDEITNKYFKKYFESRFQDYEWQFLPAIFNDKPVECKMIVLFSINPKKVKHPSRQKAYILEIKIYT